MSKPTDLVKPLLATHNLSVGYNKEALFASLNLELHRDQLVCFMGPNGVGKSTLIRTLASLQKPLAGKVMYGDPPQDALSAIDLPKMVSVVLTDRIYFANLTVYELITFGRYPYLTWNLNLTEEDKKILGQSVRMLRIDHLVSKKLY